MSEELIGNSPIETSELASEGAESGPFCGQESEENGDDPPYQWDSHKRRRNRSPGSFLGP